MSATAEHCRAGVLQARLLASVDARPVVRRLPASPRGQVQPMFPGGGPRLSELKLAAALDPEKAPAIGAVLTSPPLASLPITLRRELVHLVALARGRPELVGALVAIFLADLPSRERVEVEAVLDISRGLLGAPLLLDALSHLLRAPVYLGLEPSVRARVLHAFGGPRVTELSDPAHQETLTRWWTPRARELLSTMLAEIPAATRADEVWAAWLHEVACPIALLSSTARPGLFIVCVGAPDDPSALSYARTVFVGPDGRLRAVLRGPDRRIAGAWSDAVDPGHPEYQVRRTVLTRDEALQLIRWILGSHIVSVGDPYEPPIFPRGAYDGILELDVRLPAVLGNFSSNRGVPLLDRGVAIAGRIVRSEADEQLAFFREVAEAQRRAA